MLRPVRQDTVEFYELCSSIRSHGILNSLLVRKHDETRYEIIDGSWRFTAGKSVAYKHFPCIIVECETEEEYLALQIQTNAVSYETRPVEFAKQMEYMIHVYETNGEPLTRSELAAKVNKSAQWVSRRLKLLKLSEKAQAAVSDGTLCLSKGVALARINLHRYQHEVLETAPGMKSREFVLAVGKFIAHKRSEKMEGRIEERAEFSLRPRLQSMDTLLIELDRMTNISGIITKKGLTTAYEGAIITLQWVLNLHDEGRQQQVKELRHQLTGKERLAIIARQRFDELKTIRELSERRGDDDTIN